MLHRLEEPLSKKRRGGGAHHGLLAIDDAMVCDEQIEGGLTTTLHLEIVWKRIGKKRTVPVAPAAGSKLGQKDTAVRMYTEVRRAADGSVVLSEANQGDSFTPLYAISDLVGDFDDPRSSALEWTRKPAWT